MTEFKYNANDYERQAQRHTIPLYKKDELGHYYFSSTGTFVVYNRNFFLIGALHALNENDDKIENLYYFNSDDGSFHQMTSGVCGIQKFDKEYDIFIIDFFNKKWSGKNYFNLNKTYDDFSSFFENAFCWLGFPHSWQEVKKKQKNFNANDMLNKYVHHINENTYTSTNKFLTLFSQMIDSDKENFVCGSSPLGEVEFTYGGKKHIPKLEGMSGGCFFIPTKTHNLAKFDNGEIDLDNSFIFLGIGLECHKIDKKSCKVYGLNRTTIKKLLQEYLDNNPLQLIVAPCE